MKLKTMLAVASLAVATVVASGCQNTVVYTQAWYDVYGNHCGDGAPSAGCNFYADGVKVIASEDPYYYQSALYYGDYFYTDSYGFGQEYVGYAWLSPTGVLYNEWGNALNEDADKDSRDVISDVAKQEKAVVTKVGKDFAAKYALSEETGVQIAKTLNDWATLSKRLKRARTDQDVADFSKRLYGVGVDKAQGALDSAKKGDFSGIESVNKEVATYWGTSPETSKAILKSWYKNELNELGVK
ncbi:MAG: hypothetical protein HY075_10265 [Deltaproteobacteria bacterium]|nr:hypothetical protein [Deltaproteobacteria bacterium]